MAQKTTTATNNLETTSAQSPKPTISSSGGRSLVFISHDSRDADLAESFANLLSDVSAGTLKSFRSSDKKGSSGIEFGAEWYKAIMSQLGDATDVVALLTQHSINRPWILYEAGVAKGKLDTNVLGIALGVPLEKVSTGPFGQFQNCGDDEDSLTKLVIQLLTRNPDAAPRVEAVHRQVIAFKSEIKNHLSPKGKTHEPAGTDDTGIAKLFEEVKAMVRELPESVARAQSLTRRDASKRNHRNHPMILVDEVLFHPSWDNLPQGSATSWLIFISLLREELPWIYEIGYELYLALRSQDQKAITDARTNLIHTLEISSRPFFREIILESEGFLHLIRLLPRILDDFLSKFGHIPSRPPIRMPQALTKEALEKRNKS